MKKILFLGSKDKSDLVMYIGLTLAKLGLRTLIVDPSTKQRYLNLYTHVHDNSDIYDFYNVDIVAESSMNDLKKHIPQIETKYDVMLLDIDDTRTIAEWNNFEHRYYVGNLEKLTILEDIELLSTFAKTHSDELQFNKVLFSLYTNVDEDYLDEKTNFKIKWGFDTYDIPYDEGDMANKINVQFEMKPIFKKLSREYRKVIATIITEITGYPEKDTKDAFKQLEKGIY